MADADGKPIAAIVNYAAHPTLYGDDMLEVSADWPGVMAQDVEKKYPKAVSEIGGHKVIDFKGLLAA